LVLIFVYFFKLCIKYWNKNTKKGLIEHKERKYIIC